jgi:hypothetical protein
MGWNMNAVSMARGLLGPPRKGGSVMLNKTWAFALALSLAAAPVSSHAAARHLGENLLPEGPERLDRRTWLRFAKLRVKIRFPVGVA